MPSTPPKGRRAARAASMPAYTMNQLMGFSGFPFETPSPPLEPEATGPSMTMNIRESFQRIGDENPLLASAHLHGGATRVDVAMSGNDSNEHQVNPDGNDNVSGPDSNNPQTVAPVRGNIAARNPRFVSLLHEAAKDNQKKVETDRKNGERARLQVGNENQPDTPTARTSQNPDNDNQYHAAGVWHELPLYGNDQDAVENQTGDDAVAHQDEQPEPVVSRESTVIHREVQPEVAGSPDRFERSSVLSDDAFSTIDVSDEQHDEPLPELRYTEHDLYHARAAAEAATIARLRGGHDCAIATPTSENRAGALSPVSEESDIELVTDRHLEHGPGRAIEGSDSTGWLATADDPVPGVQAAVARGQALTCLQGHVVSEEVSERPNENDTRAENPELVQTAMTALGRALRLHSRAYIRENANIQNEDDRGVGPQVSSAQTPHQTPVDPSQRETADERSEIQQTEGQTCTQTCAAQQVNQDDTQQTAIRDNSEHDAPQNETQNIAQNETENIAQNQTQSVAQNETQSNAQQTTTLASTQQDHPQVPARSQAPSQAQTTGNIRVPTRVSAQVLAQVPLQVPAQTSAQVPTQAPAQIHTQAHTQAAPAQTPTQVPAQIPAHALAQISPQVPARISTQIPTQAPAQISTPVSAHGGPIQTNLQHGGNFAAGQQPEDRVAQQADVGTFMRPRPLDTRRIAAFNSRLQPNARSFYPQDFTHQPVNMQQVNMQPTNLQPGSFQNVNTQSMHAQPGGIDHLSQQRFGYLPTATPGSSLTWRDALDEVHDYVAAYYDTGLYAEARAEYCLRRVKDTIDSCLNRRGM